MEDSEWIDVRDHLPTIEDADSTGRVMVWHALNGAMFTGWHRLEENRFITHWQKTPKGPEKVRSVKELENSRKFVLL